MQARIQKALAKRQAGEGGFTLIELLVVIIIIGILAAIAIPAFLSQREKAWRSAVESDVRNAAIQMESIATSNGGVYPTEAAGTVAFAAASGVIAGETFVTSDNVQIVIANTGNAFTITGSHQQLGGQSIIYNSATGGLGDWNTGTTGGDTGD